MDHVSLTFVRPSRSWRWLALVPALIVASTVFGAPPQPPPGAAPAEDGNWTMPGKNAASTRFSGLDDVNAGNVGGLRVEFTFSTGVLRGHESAPIVRGDTMYLITPYPNHVYALDLTKPGAPQKWRYDPKPIAAAQGIACCDVVNRGVTIDGDSRLQPVALLVA